MKNRNNNLEPDFEFHLRAILAGEVAETLPLHAGSVNSYVAAGKRHEDIRNVACRLGGPLQVIDDLFVFDHFDGIRHDVNEMEGTGFVQPFDFCV